MLSKYVNSYNCLFILISVSEPMPPSMFHCIIFKIVSLISFDLVHISLKINILIVAALR